MCTFLYIIIHGLDKSLNHFNGSPITVPHIDKSNENASFLSAGVKLECI